MWSLRLRGVESCHPGAPCSLEQAPHRLQASAFSSAKWRRPTLWDCSSMNRDEHRTPRTQKASPGVNGCYFCHICVVFLLATHVRIGCYYCHTACVAAFTKIHIRATYQKAPSWNCEVHLRKGGASFRGGQGGNLCLGHAHRDPRLHGQPSLTTPPHTHTPIVHPSPSLPAFQTAEADPVSLDDLSFGEGPEKDLF